MPHQEPGHQEQDLLPSSSYNTIHRELGLYKPNKQKMSAMSAPAQQAKSYPTSSEIDSYEEDGEVYDREKLGLRPNDLIFMKHVVLEKN
jgi:hypothetical protein